MEITSTVRNNKAITNWYNQKTNKKFHHFENLIF